MAGTLYVDGRIPGQIVGTPTQVTSDSGTFTSTETVIASVTVPVGSGRTYSVHFYGKFQGTDNDDVRAILREDSLTGTSLQSDRRELDADNQGTFGQTFHMQAFYLADASEDKTFVATGTLDSGAGAVNLEATSLRPTLLYVRYEFG